MKTFKQWWEINKPPNPYIGNVNLEEKYKQVWDAFIDSAADEIARLDKENSYYARVAGKWAQRVNDLEDYLEAHELTKEFEEWIKRNTEV